MAVYQPPNSSRVSISGTLGPTHHTECQYGGVSASSIHQESPSVIHLALHTTQSAKVTVYQTPQLI